MMFSDPIRTTVTVTADGKDISSDLSPDLLSFSYTDNADGEADEISLTLKDPQARWAGAWQPEAGLTLEAYVTQQGGPHPGTLHCGTFYADSFRFSSSPTVASLRAQSIPMNTPIRRKKKSRAWEKKSFRDIAAQIAGENGLALVWDAPDGEALDRRDQNEQSDLEFITRLAEEGGMAVKVDDTRLVIYGKEAYEQKAPADTLTLYVSPLSSWEFSAEHSERYKSVTVKYRDPQKKSRKSAASKSTQEGGAADSNPAVNSYTATDDKAGESAQEYEEKTRAKSPDEARRMAEAKLRQLNERSIRGSISMLGDTSKAAGQVIALAGFGVFSGNWIIERATHDVSGSGYVTRLDIRKVQKSKGASEGAREEGEK